MSEEKTILQVSRMQSLMFTFNYFIIEGHLPFKILYTGDLSCVEVDFVNLKSDNKYYANK